jgi:hypothetical protein
VSPRRGNRPLQIRLDPVFRQRIKAEATQRYSGNESEVIRQALLMYLDLREAHGSRFEIVVEALRGERRETVAA